jgi:uncharacterized membrane protein
MEPVQPSHGTRAGMIGGLLFVFVGLSMGEVVKTALLAAIGAAVSYGVSVGLRWVGKRFRRRV